MGRRDLRLGLTFHPGEAALHILVEWFEVFGIHIQYLMPLAVLVVGVAVGLSVWLQKPLK